MSFDDALEIVLRDKRSKLVPILFIVQTLIICEDNDILKETESNVSAKLPTELFTSSKRH